MSVEKFDEVEFVGKFKAFNRTLERRLRALKDATRHSKTYDQYLGTI